MVLRERSTRRLYLEYEAFRASSTLFEAYRETSSLNPDDDRILGFGLYGSDGVSLLRLGTAPSQLDPSDVAALSGAISLKNSIILARPLGPGAPGMPGLGRMQGGMGRGMMRPGWDQKLPPSTPLVAPPGPLPDAAAQPRALWLEYSLGGYWREQTFLFGSAAAASLALAALFIVLQRLYRRNAELGEREFKNRELVQLGEAARTLVHEIKNPLGIIRVQAASLRRLDPANAAAKAAEKAGLIDEEVLRLANLADRIREFLKGGEGEPREIELGPWLIEFAARYTGGGDGGEIALGETATGARSRIDPERLSLALDNLVRNAREAAPSGPPPLLSLAARGRRWEISVSDRGPGVAQENVARLFEPFFTTKQRGSGIGLALARRVAQSAGGDLEYRPRQGGGAIFAILLPAS